MPALLVSLALLSTLFDVSVSAALPDASLLAALRLTRLSCFKMHDAAEI